MSLNLSSILRAAKNSELIITPVLHDWLMQHGDDPVPEDIAQWIHTLMTTPPRNRSASFSASAAGMCHRRQVLGYLGVPEGGAIDPWLQNVFNDGKWRHLRWQTMLLMAGLLDDIEDPLVWKKMRSRGTMDGSGHVYDGHPRPEWKDLEYGFELKGVSGFLFPTIKKNEEMKLEHKRQVSRYFLMSGLDLFIIIYENKANNEWFEWVIEPDLALIEEQREELKELNRAVDRKRLPPILPSCKAQVGPIFKECPYGGRNGPCLKAGSWPRLRKQSP